MLTSVLKALVKNLIKESFYVKCDTKGRSCFLGCCKMFFRFLHLFRFCIHTKKLWIYLFIYFWNKDTLLTKGTRGTIHPELEPS